MVFFVSCYNIFMSANLKKRVGVLRGGNGDGYNVSLKKGGDLLSCIFDKLSNLYKPVDIFVDKNHIWHIGGVPVNPGDLAGKVDVVWNTAHPSLSNILKSLSIPHISTSSFVYGLLNNDDLLREQSKNINLAMPRKIIISAYQEDIDGPRSKFSIKKAKEIFEKFSAPWTVKSFTENSNMGIHLAKTFPELVEAIEDGVTHGKSILVEEFIPGKVASLHVVPNFRNEKKYIFPLGNSFGNFSLEEKNILFGKMKDLCECVGECHYLKADFVLTPKGRVYLLQIDSTPDILENSHFTQVCELAGTKTCHVIEHVLEQA